MKPYLSPHRVVSLVPSTTESLFELGFGSTVVGITDYCIYPAAALSGLPRIGGPKNPDIAAILALRPDLVLANQEENTQQAVDSLRSSGIEVWVTFPKTVRQAVDDLWLLLERFGGSKAAAQRLQSLEVSLDWARAAAQSQTPWRYFCPIWYQHPANGQPWWMTFNSDTYCSDLLALLGGENVFSGRKRRFPLAADIAKAAPQPPDEQADTRYPRVSLAELRQAAPELVLLPSEPYAFEDAHRQEMVRLLEDTPAGKTGNIRLLDGTLITWPGTRLAQALASLPALLFHA